MRKRRFIVHVDMDAFFAAIEQRDDSSLSGRPVIVGADPKGGKGRGVVSTCSYEARRFGIHSAMPISIAYRLCPGGIFLPVDMEKYEAVSQQIYKILYDFTPDIEPISIDEAFLDITGSYQIIGAPLKTCLLIKSRINRETGGLTASVGLAPTKMAAKIASDLKKPDGMVEVTEERLLDFLHPLDVGKIWGLGEKSKKILNDIGIATIGDLAKRDANELTAIFGKNGQSFWELANGIDESEVETGTAAKSISNEVTFDKDTADTKRIESALMHLCEKVSGRLRQESFKARTITLKIRLKGFQTYTRSVTIPASTNFADTIFEEARQLYRDFDAGKKFVRLIGVRASNLMPLNFKDSLFAEITDKKKEEVHKAIDRIRGKFGDNSIYRAGGRV